MAPELTKHKRKQLRAKDDRPNLLEKLIIWREEPHSKDPYRLIRLETWICDDSGLELLSKTHPSNIQSVQDIVDLLHETDKHMEFGSDIYTTIIRFDKA